MRDRHSIKGAELLDAAERLWLRARPTLYVFFSGWMVVGWHRFIGAPRSIGTEREECTRRDLLLGNYVARQL
jgi:hypothetical protein